MPFRRREICRLLTICAVLVSVLQPATCSPNSDHLRSFTTALPTIALFALHQNRICAVTSSVAFLIIMLITVVPYQGAMARQTVNFIAYQAFLLYIHFKKESVRVSLHPASGSARELRACSPPASAVGAPTPADRRALTPALYPLRATADCTTCAKSSRTSIVLLRKHRSLSARRATRSAG